MKKRYQDVTPCNECQLKGCTGVACPDWREHYFARQKSINDFARKCGIEVGTKPKKATGNGKILITDARINANLTQVDVGILVGMRPQTIGRYERGLVKPSYEAMCKLAEAYGVPVERLSLPEKVSDG